LKKEMARLKGEMLAAAADLEFEKAAELRDRLLALERRELGV
jgi:excinuclease ABC subunit B